LKKYLLDPNICIFYLKGKYDLDIKIEEVDPENCFVSEITMAELLFGVENSEHREKNRRVLNQFLSGIKVLPIFQALPLYAKEKARLKKLGIPLDDFDLLIGATAVHFRLTMVSDNQKHFKRMKGLELVDWTAGS